MMAMIYDSGVRRWRRMMAVMYDGRWSAIVRMEADDGRRWAVAADSGRRWQTMAAMYGE